MTENIHIYVTFQSKKVLNLNAVVSEGGDQSTTMVLFNSTELKGRAVGGTLRENLIPQSNDANMTF